ncbi:MAG TPA: hypothetical protein VG014_03130 [Acidimicrobiales bacterium]|jgi:hypothetical protein|nr:hypothetical protein [Acidimicrobiales bacterium]
MSTIEVPDVALGGIDTDGVMHRVTGGLHDIAAEIDRMSEASLPNMDLLEASRAIQSALVSLSNWNGSDNDRIPVVLPDTGPLTLSEAWIAARLADPLDARRTA